MKLTKANLAVAILAINSAAIADEIQELDTTKVETENETQQDVVTSLTIEEKMINTPDDLVRDIPGVVIKSTDSRWGGTSFNIRGVDEDRVALTIDGVPQAESLQFRRGEYYGYFKGGRIGFAIEHMKQITITKGADSVVTGSGALGGSVRLVTKDADDFLKPEGNDAGSQISSNYMSASDTVNLSLSGAARMGSFEALAIVTKEEGHETENHTAGLDVGGWHSERPDPQDRDRTSVLFKLNYDLSKTNTIGIVFEGHDVNTINYVKSAPTDWYSNRIGDDTRESKRFGIYQKLEADARLFDRLEWSLDRQQTDFEAETRQWMHLYEWMGIPRRYRIDTRSFDQEITYLNVDFAKTLSAGNVEHELFYGFAYGDKSLDNELWRDYLRKAEMSPLLVDDSGLRRALIPHADVKNYSVFLMDKVALSKTTQLDVGIRYDNYDYSVTANPNFRDDLGNSLGDRSFDCLGGSMGLIQRLGDHYKLSAKLGRGFRVPTIEELYTRIGQPDIWDRGPNPELDMETVTSFDVTFGGQFDVGYFNITPFLAKYDDFIEQVERTRIMNERGPDGKLVLNEYITSANVGAADVKGLEVSAGLDLHKALGWAQGWTTSFSSAYNKGEHKGEHKGEQKNGKPLGNIQPFNAIVGLSYAADNWGLDARMNYTAAKKAVDTECSRLTIYGDGPTCYQSNTATVFDLTGYYNITKQFTLRAGLYNLTDKEYYHWNGGIRRASDTDLRPGPGVVGNGITRFTEPGRNFTVRADYKF